MYRSYSVNDMPEPIRYTTHQPSPKQTPPAPKPKAEKIAEPQANDIFKGIGIKSEDAILLLVIFILIFNNCDDKLLLMALVYIFLSEYLN